MTYFPIWVAVFGYALVQLGTENRTKSDGIYLATRRPTEPRDRRERDLDLTAENVTSAMKRLKEVRSALSASRSDDAAQLIAQCEKDLELAQAEDRDMTALLEAVGKKVTHSQARLARMEIAAKAQKSEGEELEWLQRMAGYVTIAGLALSAVGFVVWYVKAQRYQDEATLFALREQKAKTLTAELALGRQKVGTGLVDPTKSTPPPSASSSAP